MSIWFVFSLFSMRTMDFLVMLAIFKKASFVSYLLLPFTNMKVELHPDVSVQPEKNQVA